MKKENKKNTFIKWFTIFLILVFLAWTLWTWVLVLSWPSNQNQETTK